MTRLKTALVASVLLLVGLSLKGDVLYWMVDDQTAENFPYAYASVSKMSGGYLPYVDDEGQTWSEVNAFEPGAFKGGTGVYVDVGGLTDEKFRVELFNSEGAPFPAAYSDHWWSYEELLSIKAIVAPSMEKEEQTPWRGGTFTAAGTVPEPTSGLMLLLGTALLALRRKRA